MNFEWALCQMREGKRVTRSSWKEPWMKLVDFFEITYSHGHPVLRSLFSNKIGGQDLLAEDWIEYQKEEIK